MFESSRLLEQRSAGEAVLHLERNGPRVLRESGAAKVRLPRGSNEAIFINTGGGLAGGDNFRYDFSVGAGAALTLTSQAAERVYRTLGPPARVATALNAGPGSTLHWLPQETICYDGASLRRSFAVSLAENARFLAIEPLVFGRMEMGESVKSVDLRDRWRIERAGKLVHAENLTIDAAALDIPVALNGARAMATVISIAADAEARLDAVRATLDARGGASAWNGKLVARLLAKDGLSLRKALIAVLGALAGGAVLPRIWTN